MTSTAMPYGTMPPPDVVEFLVHQHGRIRDLMMEVMALSGEPRKKAFRELVRLLSVHETAEEEVVHPVARRRLDAGDAIIDDRLEEEHDAKQLLEQLDGMDPADPEFLPLFLRMRQAVITHAVYEQRYEFSYLRHKISTAELAGLRGLAKAAESTAPTHPHPGVESAAANLLLGLPTAIMDRARDAIRAAREKVSGSGG
jgi:hypothetical protein